MRGKKFTVIRPDGGNYVLPLWTCVLHTKVILIWLMLDTIHFLLSLAQGSCSISQILLDEYLSEYGYGIYIQVGMFCTDPSLKEMNTLWLTFHCSSTMGNLILPPKSITIPLTVKDYITWYFWEFLLMFLYVPVHQVFRHSVFIDGMFLR